MSIAAQIELITNDPRDESTRSIFADIREFVQASRECKGLLTMGQAAKILSVPSGQVSVWVTRGRLKSVTVLGVKMVSAGEVVALLRERNQEIRSSGGRGIKAPSLAALVESAWEDVDPMA